MLVLYVVSYMSDGLHFDIDDFSFCQKFTTLRVGANKTTCISLVPSVEDEPIHLGVFVFCTFFFLGVF